MNLQIQPLANSVHLQDDPVKVADLSRMKRVATGLLVMVTLTFVVASIYEDYYVWIGFVRAGAEAAMVGAIADWFAVTALFRHPLGLKIPHTAILPRRKDSFARSFAEFIQGNFLAENVISGRLQRLNVAQLLGRWLSQTENSQAIADFVADTLRGGVQIMKDEDIQELIEQALVTQIRAIRVAPVLGNSLYMILSGERQHELLSGTINFVHQLLEENKTVIRQKISDETPWWVPPAVDTKIYQKVVDAIDETLNQASANPDHPLHEKIGEAVQNFINDLQHDQDMIARGELLKEELLEDPGVQTFSVSLWQDIKRALLVRSDDPNSRLRQPIQKGVVRLGHALQEDKALQAKINQWVEHSVAYLVCEYGHEVGEFISHTISEWDAEATSHKIELHVGKDLQYIRINGTLVGGLVGLVLHTIHLLLL